MLLCSGKKNTDTTGKNIPSPYCQEFHMVKASLPMYTSMTQNKN